MLLINYLQVYDTSGALHADGRIGAEMWGSTFETAIQQRLTAVHCSVDVLQKHYAPRAWPRRIDSACGLAAADGREALAVERYSCLRCGRACCSSCSPAVCGTVGVSRCQRGVGAFKLTPGLGGAPELRRLWHPAAAIHGAAHLSKTS